MGIPKIIHYCWFGKNPLDPLTKMCKASWEKYYPDYEIMLWDEEKFDINKIPFTKEAYEHKKWAFVSDYVRLYALLSVGGIYVDTDFEIIKRLDDDILMNRALIGYENDRWFSTAFIASEPNNEWIQLLLDYYNGRHFIEKDGSMHIKPNPIIVTEISKLKCGFQLGDDFMDVGGVKIMPTISFSPYKRKDTIEHSAYMISETETYGIHHLAASWVDKKSISRRIQKLLRPILPMRIYALIVDIYNKITFK
jgi:hypothetical protein